MEVVEIHNEEHIALARQLARRVAEKLGFTLVDKTRVATAVSELARNVYVHGSGGLMEIEEIHQGERIGIRFIFIDEGPGIASVEQAMQDGFSTSKGLGQGLPGSRRLMDDLQIESELGKGTKVETIKWK
jgi:serine/threonine-protein kinase RsbT